MDKPKLHIGESRANADTLPPECRPLVLTQADEFRTLMRRCMTESLVYERIGGIGAWRIVDPASPHGVVVSCWGKSGGMGGYRPPTRGWTRTFRRKMNRECRIARQAWFPTCAATLRGVRREPRHQ